MLNRTFDAASANRKWVADFTYLWTVEGWRYGAAIVGLFSRGGWVVHPCDDDRAAGHRGTGDGDLAAGVRPTPYCIIPIEGAVYECAIPTTPGRPRRHLQQETRGNVWDNAVMESYFFSLKTERTAAKMYRTRAQAKADVFNFIECFYNPRLRDSTLGYRNPMAFEKQARLA